jgi:hypothetical protein
VFVLGAWAGHAQESPDNWPCIQRYVPEIAAGVVWSGPPLDEAKDAPPPPPGLVSALASRDAPLDAAMADAAAWAKALPAEAQDPALTGLFAGVLEQINGQRARVLAGILNYADQQKALAERIAEQGRALEGYRLDVAASEQAEMEAVKAQRAWDMRLFDDRRRMLPQVCDQAVLLEQRAFAVGRALQAELG